MARIQKGSQHRHLLPPPPPPPPLNITTAPPASVAITNVRVFDGHKVGQPETIVIKGGYIVANTTKVEDAIDAVGHVLIPGLIDSHAHPDAVRYLQDLTSYGVTSVLNMACTNNSQCNSMKNSAGVASFITAGLPAIGLEIDHYK